MSALSRPTPIMLLIVRIAVGGIFLIAGIDKVQAPGAFADAVRAFHILPPPMVLPFAFVVPWLELLVAAYLLVGFLSRLAASGAIILLSSFVFALGISLARGDTNHACGCFGSATGANAFVGLLTGGATITWWDVIRDLLLILLTAMVLVHGPGSFSVEAVLADRRREPEYSSRGHLIRRGDKYRA